MSKYKAFIEVKSKLFNLMEYALAIEKPQLRTSTASKIQEMAA